MRPLVAVQFDGHALRAIDQTLLPWEERELVLTTAAEVADAIRRLAIRGAPLIGVAAGYGVALELMADPSASGLDRACTVLVEARPTAVNLRWAVNRVRDAALTGDSAATVGRQRSIDALGRQQSIDPDAAASIDADVAPSQARVVDPSAALNEARTIEADELASSEAIAAHGAELLGSARRVMTHCNTGALAAPGRGTALAVIAEMAARGTLERVLATESRPLLQGARLTVYELRRMGIDHALIVDSAAAGLIGAGAVDAVIVGCDRVAANGDVANKVGTYGLALAANATGIPFVVACPTSTIDPACPTGAEITVEERDPDEVRMAGAALLTVPGTPCRNPAFDVTPAELVTALVTEEGVKRLAGV